MITILIAACVTLYIYDGDNVRCNGITYRLAEHNAPEIKGQCVAERWLALIARDRLRELVRDPTATLEEVKCVGSNFGRHCAIVRVNSVSVSPALIRAHLVEPYKCTKKCQPRINWCATS